MSLFSFFRRKKDRKIDQSHQGEPVSKDQPKKPEDLYIQEQIFEQLKKDGRALANNKLYEQAINIWLQAVEIKPEDWLILYSLANAYFQTDDYQSASIYCKKAIQLKPDMIDLYELLSFTINNPVERSLNDPPNLIIKFKKAIDNYIEAIDTLPKKEYLYSRAYNLFEIVYGGEEVWEYLSEIAKLMKNNTAYTLLGEIYLVEDHLEEAIASLEIAVKLNPNNEVTIKYLNEARSKLK